MFAPTKNRFFMFTTTITPKFGDTDALRHINNNTLTEWFELARNPIFGFFNPTYNLDKWNLILVHLDLDFLSQIYYGKDVEVRTWISRIGRSSFEVYQEAWQNEIVCVKGKTVIVYFDFAAQKSEPIPDSVRPLLEEHVFF